MRGTQKLWTLGGAAVIALIAIVGYLMFISPANNQISQAQSQTSDVQTHNTVLQARLDQLAAENKHLATYQAALGKAQAALPASDGLANFLRELQNLGTSTLVTVTQLGVNAPIATQTPAAAGATPSATPTAAPGAVTTPTASTYSIPIVITATGSVAHLTAFLDQLQEVQPRAVLVTEASLGTGPQSTVTSSAAQTTLQLTMSAFVAPMGASAPSTTAGS